jgi:signal transduction histidine kinase
VFWLAQCTLFDQLPATELSAVAKVAEVREYAAGDVVFQEGDPGDGLYVVGEGQVQASFLVAPNDRRVLSLFGPGEFVGEMAVIDTHPRSATVTAVAASRLAFLPCAAVRMALERSPVFASNLTREVVQRMREFTQTYTREVVQAERLALVGRFARSIVHDFKNPLNIIGISAEMMCLPQATVEARITARMRIRRQVDRLSNMINELLEFTRGATGTRVLARVQYSQFLRPILEELTQEAEARGVRLEQANPPPSVPVMMDPRRLSHVLHNLINNACEAMADGGTIRLRYEERAGEVLTLVHDTGPGIAEAIVPRLFEAFATYGKASGTGLGLSICKRIIEDHGGRIEAHNAPEGGAVFAFALPLVGADPSS